jgi:hypothetical protein
VFVPGHPHDLFLSYAHADEQWVEAFRAAVAQGLRERLGFPVALWQDKRDIEFTSAWPSEIDEAVQQTAAFLAVCSPSYFTSNWCAKEIEKFLKHHGGSIAGLKIAGSGLHRLAIVVKNPSDDKLHEDFYPELQNISFFTGKEVHTPGQPAYIAKLNECVSGLAELLRTMRNSKQALFLAPPPEDLEDQHATLKKQFLDWSFNVRPEGIMRAGFVDRRIREEMERSEMSVFLLGGRHDEEVIRQFRIARELGRRVILWIHAGLANSADPAQKAFVEEVRTMPDLPAGSHILGGASIQEVINALKELLRPSRGATPPASADGDARKVYLLYDVTDEEDVEVARRLEDMILDQRMTVFQPSRLSDQLVRHRQFLTECDGVLLFRGKAPAPDRWLQYTADEVALAERLLRRPPLPAKFCLLEDTQAIEKQDGLQVIPFTPALGSQTLAPFFEQVRAARSTP